MLQFLTQGWVRQQLFFEGFHLEIQGGGGLITAAYKPSKALQR
jgi:hypothetical protein